MFYSHEVLTSRKYGVATVWLVATLGASSKLKRINRKAIREVNVPKACQTIIDPGAPMALRLQGNLLYGVSRVYVEQCGYVLSDAQSAHTSMRMYLKTIKNAGLDPEAGRARPEQIMLQDDPAFLPELTLPPPELLAEFTFLSPPDKRPTGDSQILTPFGSQVQHDHASPASAVGGLVLPSSSSGPHGEFRIGEDEGPGSVGGVTGMLGADNGPEFLEEAFGFDADGNMVDFEADRPIAGTPLNRQGPIMRSDGSASARVRAEHEEGQQAGAEQFDDQMDIDFGMFDDQHQEEALGIEPQHQSDEHAQPQQADKSEAAIAAPMQRKARQPKSIQRDHTVELHNRDLTDWNNNYLQNMAEASRLKHAHRAPTQAKKNAEFWVWGAGIGGIGRRLPGATAPTPLDMFLGDNLYELFTGKDRRALAGKKHDRDSGIDEETAAEGARRVRPRLDDDEEQIGRGHDDEGLVMMEDEVEFPRDEPAALDDQALFSAMPWNISASIRGSSAIPRSTGLQGSLQQRGSRMISDSPLKGRGVPCDTAELQRLSGDDDVDISGIGLPEQISSDGVYLEAENLPQSPVRTRVQDALSAEGGNFLAFISDAITEKRQRIQAGLLSDELQAEAAEDVDEVLFEELLPPEQSTKMVACQGLMMVLALGTGGMLNVRQDGPFEEIGLRLTEKATTMAAEEAAGRGRDAEEVDDDETEDERDVDPQRGQATERQEGSGANERMEGTVQGNVQAAGGEEEVEDDSEIEDEGDPAVAEEQWQEFINEDGEEEEEGEGQGQGEGDDDDHASLYAD